MNAISSLAAFSIAVGAVAACARPHPLLQPAPAALTAQAPDSFTVDFETSRGNFTVMARRAWSPHGVDRLYYLVKNGFYDDTRFFRVIPRFVAQFGIPADPAVAAVWKDRTIPDDPVRASNVRGAVTFARGGPATRTTQLFVNLRDNVRLDTLGGFGFPPIGEVTNGMGVVDSLHSGYGESMPRGRGPMQDSISLQGNAWLDRNFPALDRVRRATITQAWGK